MQAAHRLDVDRLYLDIEEVAASIQVPVQESLVRQVLSAYHDHFALGAVALRTTNKPPEKRDLSVRYIDLDHAHQPYDIALEHGLLTETGHPIERLIAEIEERFPLLGYGVDMGIRHGVEKIWPLFSEAIPIQAAYDQPSMPPSVRNYADYFSKYDLNQFSLYAIDYWNKTVNLYFMVIDPTRYPAARTADMIADLGFQVPADDELEVNARTGVIYLTFSWDSPRCERLSFGVPHVPEESFPMHMDPVLAGFFRQTPIVAPQRIASIQTAYLPDNRSYLKIEVDYTGTMFQALGAAIATLL